MGHNLEALKKALEAVEAMGVTPMDLLAYAIVLDKESLLENSTPGTTLLELVVGEQEQEQEDPTLGTDILATSISMAEQMS